MEMAAYSLGQVAENSMKNLGKFDLFGTAKFSVLVP